MLTIEYEEYDFKDILSLFMDMFKVDRSYFIVDDFLKKKYAAYNFFDVFTNYNKCFDFMTRDNNMARVVPELSEWTKFANKIYKELTEEQYDDD